MPIALHNAVDDDESSEASYRRITPAEFAKLDPNTVTLLDLREPAGVVAEILADRGYDVASLDGGFQGYLDYLETHHD